MGNQTANKVARAFIDGKRMTLGNYQSTGEQFLLFGNVIAEVVHIDEGSALIKGFIIQDCGKCTPTTAIALNALPGVRLRRLKGEWICNEKFKWDGKPMLIEYKS